MPGERAIQFIMKRIHTNLNDFGTMVRDLSEEIRKRGLTDYRAMPFPITPKIFFHVFRDEKYVLCPGVEIAYVSVYRVTSTTSANITCFCVNYVNYH